MRSIQRAEPGSTPDWLIGVRGGANRAGDAADRAAQRARHQPANAGDVLIVGGARDARLLELLGQQGLVESVEEQRRWRGPRRQGRRAGRGSGRGRARCLARARCTRARPPRSALRETGVRLSTMSDAEQSGVQRRPTGDGHERGGRDHPADARAAALGLLVVIVLVVARHARIRPPAASREKPGSSAGIGKSTSERAGARRRGGLLQTGVANLSDRQRGEVRQTMGWTGSKRIGGLLFAALAIAACDQLTPTAPGGLRHQPTPTVAL